MSEKLAMEFMTTIDVVTNAWRNFSLSKDDSGSLPDNESFSTPLAPTNGTLSLQSQSPTEYSREEAASLGALFLALHGIVMPIISVVGVTTNLINIIVLSCIIKRSRTPVYHMLLAMAVADFLLMGVVLIYCARFFLRAAPLAVKEQVENIDYASYFFFHTWETFANVCGTASNWCVVAVTAFRFVAVYFPLHAPVWCTRQRARLIIAGIVVGSVALHLPYALVNELDLSSGRFKLQDQLHESYKSTYYVALLVVYHVIPWAASGILVALLLAGLWSSQQQRATRACVKQEEQKTVEQRRLSVTLISVALWFVASTTPNVVYHFMEYAHPESSRFTYRPAVQRLFAFAQMVLLLNYAANFFMYAFINQTYRSNLAAILGCRRAGSAASRAGLSVHTVMTTHLSASTELQPLKYSSGGIDSRSGSH